MELNFELLRKNMKEYEEEIDTKIKSCESEENYTLAFLFNWIIVEKILKDIERELRKKKLYFQLEEWKKYLKEDFEEKILKKPEGKLNFSLESIKIPELNLFKIEGWNVAKIEELLGGVKKYREKRNRIVHHSETVSKKQYPDYKKAVENAKNEIRKILE